MQNNATERTKSEPKRRRRPLLIIAAAVVLFGIGMSKQFEAAQAVRLGNDRYHLEVAATPEQQRLGLGGRASMPKNHGMLFVFNAPSPQCFWMKDTHFPLDIIWLDAQKHIMKIDADISPDTYPAVFCSEKPIKYVIELNAGEAARARLRPGQTVQI